MSTYPLKGVNFTDQEYTPDSDCCLWRQGLSDGQIAGSTPSSSGATVTLSTGWWMFGGKQLYLDQPVSIPLTGLTNGYARLVFNVDLSETSTEQVFNQAWISVEYAATESAFPDLTKQHVGRGGTVYQAEYARFQLVSGAVDHTVFLAISHARGLAIQHTVQASAWTTVSTNVHRAVVSSFRMNPVDTVTSGPDPDSQDYAASCGVRMISQGLGKFTLEARTKPTQAIKWNLLLS